MKVGTDGVLLGAWADVAAAKSILDVGAGTGVIAIMLAQRTEAAVIHAVEIDEIAWELAAQNMSKSPWASRLEVFKSPIQDFAKTTQTKYDLIVSNPPFFSGGTFSSSNDKATVRHTIKLPHGDLLSSTRTLLAEEGKFCVILPYLEGLRFKELASRYHLFCSKITEVRPKMKKPVERLLLQFEQQVKPVEKDLLVIENEDSGWTEEYVALAGDFYLKM
jgi:tRNA1Val (adenine37-N6)-methyltransferase